MDNLETALFELREEWFAELPAPEDMPVFEHSKSYLKWEQRVIYGKQSAGRKAAKVLLIAAALLVLFSVIALSTTKGREFIMHYFKDSALYSVFAETSQPVNSLTVEYIPKGYELKEQFENSGMKSMLYSKDKSWIKISKQFIETTVDFDYEKDSFELVEKNGIKYIITNVDDNVCNVIWNYNNFNYFVAGTIDKETALEVAYHTH